MSKPLFAIAAMVEDARDKEAKGNIDDAITSLRIAMSDLQLYTENEQDVNTKNALCEKLDEYRMYMGKLRMKTKSDDTNSHASNVDFKVVMPAVSWNDIIGLDYVKEELRNILVYKQRFPSALSDIGGYNSMLLYGPPGTGKTLLASAVCTEAKASFYSITAGNVLSRWQGESEKQIRSLFETARANMPSVIFIDEIDGLLSKREGSSDNNLRTVKIEFLTQMNIKNNGMLLVIGATNMPWHIDNAMVRRFEKRVYIPLPSYVDRLRLFAKLLPALFTDCNDEVAQQIGLMSDGYSSSDITHVAKEASMMPFKHAKKATQFMLCEDGKYVACETDGMPMCIDDIPDDQLRLRNVTLADLVSCLSSIRSSVDSKSDSDFTEWKHQYGTDN